MFLLSSRATAGAGVLAAAALSVALPITSAAADVLPSGAAANPEASAAAADYLVSQLTDGQFLDGEFGPSYGPTADIALALQAAGGHDSDLTAVVGYLAGAAPEYTQGVEFDDPDSAYVGATAKLAYVVEATGGDATNVDGADLLAQLAGLQQPGGTYADRSSFGDYANVFGHAFAVLAVDAAGQAPDQSVVDALLAAQCDDGGFPEAYVPAAGTQCTSGVDSTGLALVALSAIDSQDGAEATGAVDWLAGQQDDDGSFVGEAAVNSTGYAAWGLAAAGVDISQTVAWLLAQQNDDGGLPLGDGTAPSDAFATAQALPAITLTAAAAPPVATPAPTTPVTPPAPTTPAVTPTVTPTTAPAAQPSAPQPSPSADGTIVAAPSGDGFVIGGGGGGNTGGGDAADNAGAPAVTALPRTGTEAPALIGAGSVLLIGGAALVALSRVRRTRNHA